MDVYGQPEYGKSGTLYDVEPQQEFILEAGSTLNEETGFSCYSVIVDNKALQWVHIMNTNYYVPPGGWSIIRLPGVERAQAEWAAPPGTSQPSGVASTFALLTYTHEQLPPSGATIATSLNKQQTPSAANFFRIAGIGTTVIEAPAAGLQIYVLAGIFSVSIAAVGGLLALEERDPNGGIGRTIAAIGTDQVTDGVPWQAFGFIVTAGWGIQLDCHNAAATGALSILYSK